MNPSGALPEQTDNISWDSLICGVCGVASEDSPLCSSGKYVVAVHSHNQKLFYVKYTKRIDHAQRILRDIDACIPEARNGGSVDVDKLNEIFETEGFLGISPVYFGNLKTGENPEFGKIGKKK